MSGSERFRKGTYGEVELTHDGRAIKRSALFDGSALVAGNLREVSVLASYPDIPGVISCRGACLGKDGNVLEMHLPKGEPLHLWRNCYEPTVQELDNCLRDLVVGLYNLHERGILHGDLKPNNVVVKSPRGPSLAIIDLGSACFTASSTTFANGTYIYRAPEALPDPHSFGDPALTAAGDAYSLGATLYYLAHEAHLLAADSDLKQTRTWHANGGLERLPAMKPTQASRMYAAAVQGLLHADPQKRTTITSLYMSIICSEVITVVDPSPIPGAQAGGFTWPGRPVAVAAIADTIRTASSNTGTTSSSSSNCSSPRSSPGSPSSSSSSSSSSRPSFTLALACDIMDRYAAAVQQAPREAELLACATAAWGLSSNDVNSELLCHSSSGLNLTRSEVRRGLRAVLGALQLKLYCDRTAYHVLTGELRHPWVDFEVLAEATEWNVVADDIVSDYLQQRDFVMLIDE